MLKDQLLLTGVLITLPVALLLTIMANGIRDGDYLLNHFAAFVASGISVAANGIALLLRDKQRALGGPLLWMTALVALYLVFSNPILRWQMG